MNIKFIENDSSGPYARVILIREGPGNRRTNYYYKRDMLQRAINSGKFEGAQSYSNHPTPTDKRERPERSVGDLLGFFSDVKLELIPNDEHDTPGISYGKPRACVTATFHPEVTNAFIMSKLREAEKYRQMYPDKPGYIGWSIVAAGNSKPERIGGQIFNVVIDFDAIDSIDLVTRAGAGGKLLTFVEANMRWTDLFGGSKSRFQESEAPDINEAKEGVATFILEALDKAGAKINRGQELAINESISLLPPQLMTPQFLFTALQESGVELTEKQLKKFLENGEELDSLIEEVKKAEEAKKEEEEESEEEADDEEELPAGKKMKEKKQKEDDGDRSRKLWERGFKAKEAKPKMEANLSKEVRSLIEENATLRADNKQLMKLVEKSNESFREASARKLLAKTTGISESKKKFLLEAIADLDPKDQAKQIALFEEAFGDSSSKPSGAIGRNSSILENKGSRVTSFSALN